MGVRQMEQELVAFACGVCKGVSDRIRMESELFDIAGFENDIMEWSDYENEVPLLDERDWLRSNRPPERGQVRTVKVSHPFHMRMGEPFWIMYTPVLSSFNGWDSHPEEIEQFSFVQCSIERVIERNEFTAWLCIKILNVWMIKDYSERFPERDGREGYLEGFEMFGDRYIFNYQNWLFFSAGLQGNIGVWGLVKRIDSQYHMLVYGDWDFHTNNAYGGNILLPKDRIDGWLKQAMENNRYEKIE
ncbi:hypothetical protein E8L90_23850 [Brevibacillus antibioticus]|uniref:Uncharacterized protein n=2 Tax=Brevibacillus antibioticus TaxID=2570228 RepID=A0A4U2YBI4_9BACL|nr:hypothetical protein E8L90_23850 [Brevibacillus antibioticus]